MYKRMSEFRICVERKEEVDLGSCPKLLLYEQYIIYTEDIMHVYIKGCQNSGSVWKGKKRRTWAPVLNFTDSPYSLSGHKAALKNGRN